MDSISSDVITDKKLSPLSNTIPIRIKKSTARILKSHLNICNRKSHGKRVKADAIIVKALSLLNETHMDEIRQATYTSQDHLEIEYKKYCSSHGNISKDEFLKILLSTALPQVGKSIDS